MNGTILFDGFCNLCDGTVRFVLANDPAGRFRFAPLQSEAAARALRAVGRLNVSLASIVLIDAAGVHERSDAALRIAAGLRFPWPLLGIVRVVPRSVRDAAYDLIARSRYRIFGRRDRCRLPTVAERARFLA